jgi:hypothetical protein
MNTSETVSLVSRVAIRMRLVAFARSVYWAVLAWSLLFLAAVVAVRLLGVYSVTVGPMAVAMVPLAALAVALFFHRRPSPAEVAHCLDRHAQTGDLYLTWSCLDRSAGAYQSLVVQAAESEATKIQPQGAVPYSWRKPALHLTAMLFVLVIAVLFLPQWDPFGRLAQAKKFDRAREQQRNDRRATSLRMVEAKKSLKENGANSVVKRSLEDLTRKLKEMKRDDPQANLDSLNQRQRHLGEKWRKLAAEQLKTLLDQSSTMQDFAGKRQAKMREWSKELREGNDTGLRREMNDLRKALTDLKLQADPAKRTEMKRKLKERLKDLEKFASEQAGSPELTAALRRAQRQLESALDGNLDLESLQDLQETLDLAELELKELKLSAEDLKSLEMALKVIQMAKQINSEDPLDGEACEGCQSMDDYAQLFAEMMGSGETPGPGMRGQGFGEGGEAPEDNSVATDFQSKKTRSPTQAGKALLSMQSSGVSPSGEQVEEYRELVGEVQSGVSAAILQERIPPGYHDAIKRYFDTLDRPE